MSHTKMRYFEEEDILHLTISDESEANSLEINPNITVELNDAGELRKVSIYLALWAVIFSKIKEKYYVEKINLSPSKKLSSGGNLGWTRN